MREEENENTMDVRGNATESLVITAQREQISGGCWILKRKWGEGVGEDPATFPGTTVSARKVLTA